MSITGGERHPFFGPRPLLDRHEGPRPHWSSFHVDRLGNEWVSQYTLPGQPPGGWRVLTRDGTFQAQIDLPDVVEVLDIE